MQTTGAAVPGVKVRGISTYPDGQSAPPDSNAVTDAKGAYTLSFPAWTQESLGGNPPRLRLVIEVPPGLVVVSVTKDTGESGSQNAALLLVDSLGTDPINITLAPGPVVSGRVTNGLTGASLAGIMVMALRPNSQLIDGSSGDAFEIEASAKTDATGQYSLTVQSGSYVIDAVDPRGGQERFWSEDPTIFQATLLTVDRVVVGINIALVPVMGISGELRSGTTPVVGGIAGARVVAFLVGSTPCCRIVGVAMTDDNSTFLMYVPPGVYRIAITPAAGSPYAAEWWKDATAFATATDVPLGTTAIQLEVDLAKGP